MTRGRGAEEFAEMRFPAVVTVPKYERRVEENALPSGGVSKTVRTEHVADEDWDVELTIDLSALLRLWGERAVRNRGGRAILQGGMITIKRIQRQAREIRAVPKAERR